MHAQHHPGTNERRSGKDRRQWQCDHDFPYVDSHGELVTEERRKNGGRRKKDKRG